MSAEGVLSSFFQAITTVADLKTQIVELHSESGQRKLVMFY